MCMLFSEKKLRARVARVHGQTFQHVQSERTQWWPVLWHWNFVRNEARRTITALSKQEAPRLQEPSCQVLDLDGNRDGDDRRTARNASEWLHFAAWDQFEAEQDGGCGTQAIRIAMIKSGGTPWRRPGQPKGSGPRETEQEFRTRMVRRELRARAHEAFWAYHRHVAEQHPLDRGKRGKGLQPRAQQT